MAADASEYQLRWITEAMEWDRRRRRSVEEIRTTLDILYEMCHAFSYPCGGFFEHLAEEVELLRERVQPLRDDGKAKVAKRRIIPAATRKRIFERDAYRCVRCDAWIDLTIDHKIPVSRGGSDEDENLQTMCRHCNISKGTKIE